MLSERRKSKKVITLSGDFGMDQYVSWILSTKELTIDTIWEKNSASSSQMKWGSGLTF